MHGDVCRNYFFFFFPFLLNDSTTGCAVCFRSGGMCSISSSKNSLILTDVHNYYLFMVLRQYILGFYICSPFSQPLGFI